MAILMASPLAFPSPAGLGTRSGECCAHDGGGGSGGDFQWAVSHEADKQEMWLGHKIRSQAQHAHCIDDLRLLSTLFELLDLKEVHGDSVKLLLRTLKFLRWCDYSAEDLCAILAHASAYFTTIFEICGQEMDVLERGNVLATLIFLGHAYVLDETCPLHIWHQYLFHKYCPMKKLNSAVIRLMELMHFILRVEDVDLSRRFGAFVGSLRAAGALPPPLDLARPHAAEEGEGGPAASLP